MKNIIIVVFLFFSANVFPADFSGEVYKTDKYGNSVTCRASDLSMLENGQQLYVCDADNNQIARIQITRFYTTLVEARIVEGDISTIRVKMPVYSTKAQFENIEPVEVIKYEKDYLSYLWKVRLKYRAEQAGGKTMVHEVEQTMRFNKLVYIFAEISDEEVLVEMEKIKSFRLIYWNGLYYITSITIERTADFSVKGTDILIDPKLIIEETVQVNDFVKKTFTKDMLYEIVLLEIVEGYEDEIQRDENSFKNVRQKIRERSSSTDKKHEIGIGGVISGPGGGVLLNYQYANNQIGVNFGMDFSWFSYASRKSVTYFSPQIILRYKWIYNGYGIGIGVNADNILGNTFHIGFIPSIGMHIPPIKNFPVFLNLKISVLIGNNPRYSVFILPSATLNFRL